MGHSIEKPMKIIVEESRSNIGSAKSPIDIPRGSARTNHSQRDTLAIKNVVTSNDG